MNNADVARILLSHQGRFDSAEEAVRHTASLASADSSVVEKLAKDLCVPLTTATGVIVMCQHILEAVEWCERERVALTKKSLVEMSDILRHRPGYAADGGNRLCRVASGAWGLARVLKE